MKNPADMECPYCKQDGIRALNKSVMVFGVSTRCRSCGSNFVLQKAPARRVNFVFQTLVLLFIGLAIWFQEVVVAYTGY